MSIIEVNDPSHLLVKLFPEGCPRHTAAPAARREVSRNAVYVLKDGMLDGLEQDKHWFLSCPNDTNAI